MITSEKEKKIFIYDTENEISSYQNDAKDILADYVTGSTVYLLSKGAGNTKTTRILREKQNVDKLKSFLTKKHYDVAYKFAKNEKFSDEVLADISRYSGDYHYTKVI